MPKLCIGTAQDHPKRVSPCAAARPGLVFAGLRMPGAAMNAVALARDGIALGYIAQGCCAGVVGTNDKQIVVWSSQGCSVAYWVALQSRRKSFTRSHMRQSAP